MRKDFLTVWTIGWVALWDRPFSIMVNAQTRLRSAEGAQTTSLSKVGQLGKGAAWSHGMFSRASDLSEEIRNQDIYVSFLTYKYPLD